MDHDVCKTTGASAPPCCAPVGLVRRGPLLHAETVEDLRRVLQASFSGAVESFLTDIAELLQRCRDQVTNGDWRDLARSAHRLRGAAGMFGASAAADAASQLETAALTGDALRARERLACVERTVQYTARALHRLIQS